MKTLLDLESLSLFCLVVQEGSFTEAARRSGGSKATLSRKIALLEESLGVQLLIRTTRSLQATEIGRDFYSRALGLLTAHDEAVGSVKKTQSTPSGLLRVTAGVEFGTEFISPLLNEYLCLHQEVQGEIDLTGRFVDLVHEGFDVGIRLGQLEDSSLSSRKLGSIQYGLYASPQLLKAYRIQRVDQLKQVPALIFNRPDHHSEWTLVREGTERTVRMTPKMIANNHWALRSAALAGLGIAFSPTLLMREEVRSKRLIHVLPEWSSPEIPVHAVFPAQQYLAPKVRCFVDYLVERLRLGSSSGKRRIIR